MIIRILTKLRNLIDFVYQTVNRNGNRMIQRINENVVYQYLSQTYIVNLVIQGTNTCIHNFGRRSTLGTICSRCAQGPQQSGEVFEPITPNPTPFPTVFRTFFQIFNINEPENLAGIIYIVAVLSFGTLALLVQQDPTEFCDYVLNSNRFESFETRVNFKHWLTTLVHINLDSKMVSDQEFNEKCFVSSQLIPKTEEVAITPEVHRSILEMQEKFRSFASIDPHAKNASVLKKEFFEKFSKDHPEETEKLIKEGGYSKRLAIYQLLTVTVLFIALAFVTGSWDYYEVPIAVNTVLSDTESVLSTSSFTSSSSVQSAISIVEENLQPGASSPTIFNSVIRGLENVNLEDISEKASDTDSYSTDTTITSNASYDYYSSSSSNK